MKAILLAVAFVLTTGPAWAAEPEAGFKQIFNGKDLSGWDGNPKFWSVREGALTGQTTAENPTEGNTFILWREGMVDDFILRFSYKIVGGNSGMQYRSRDLGNWVVGGYQGDFEAGKTYSGILYEERGPRGIMAQRGQKTEIDANGQNKVIETLAPSDALQGNIKAEDWNEYEITARGNRLIHKINGRVTADVTDNDPKNRAFSGILALQLHAGPPMTVQAKNIRLKRLKLEDRKKIVLVGGRASHGSGQHEFAAGVQLLNDCLQKQASVLSTFYTGGWPKDPTAFDNADAILFYMDGGAGHPVIQENRLKIIDALADQGVGIACAHYAVEVPKERGGAEFLKWIGGYFEMHWSVNPHWDADFTSLPKHPITQGVSPFKINDEWYYHMRFPEGMKGVTPILSAIPPESTLQRPDGPHSGNPAVRATKGQPQHVAWAIERPDGGRGFGFTGGHFHRNWGDPNFRKLFLNALLWTAKAPVPPAGVDCEVSPDDLKKNLDKK